MSTSAPAALPVSHAQQALWLLYRLDPTSPAYHTGAALLVPAPVDPDHLGRALARLAHRHDMLRSTYHPAAGGVERRVAADPAVDLETRAAPGLDGGPLRDLARETLNLPFALDRQSFRFVLFHLAADRHLLLMAAHHIGTDAWSNWVLIRDLLEYHRQEATGEAIEHPAPAGTYHDFVRQEADLLGSDRCAELASHWQRVCADTPAGELPIDGRRAEAVGVGATHRLRLGGDEVAALRAVAAGCEVTMFALLLGCLQALIGRYGGQRRFLVGCPTSARHGAASREVVGNFVNTLLFRADLTRRTTLGDLAREAYRQVGTGMRAVGFPFSLVPRLVRPARPAGAAPLCRITFNLIGTAHPDPLLRLLLDPDSGTEPVRHAGLPIQPISLPQSEGQLDLAVHVQHSRDALTVEFRYDTGLFEPGTIHRLAVHYRRVLAAAAEQPERAVARIPLLDRAELTDLMDGTPGA